MRGVAGGGPRSGSVLLLVIPVVLVMGLVSASMIAAAVRMRAEGHKEAAKLALETRKDAAAREVVSAAVSGVETGTAGTGLSALGGALSALLGPGGGPAQGASVSLVGPAPDIFGSPQPFAVMSLPPTLRLRLGDGRVLARAFSATVSYSIVRADPLGGRTEDQADRTMRVAILEIPTQFGAEGENITVEGDTTLAGSAVGRRLVCRAPVPAGRMAMGLVSVSDASGPVDFDAEARGAGSARATAGAGRFFHGDAIGKARLVPVGGRGPEIFRQPAGAGANGEFTRYWHPYHQTSRRLWVGASGTNAWQLSTTVRDASLSGASAGPALSAGWGEQIEGLTARRHPSAGEVVYLDAAAACAAAGPGAVALFVDTGPAGGAAGNPHRPLVLLRAEDLPDAGFSLVTPATLYVGSDVGTDGAPFSLLAPEVRWGAPGWGASSVTYAGQRGRVDGSVQGSVGSMLGSTGSEMANKSVTLGDRAGASPLPPVFLRSWLIWVEEI